MQVLHALFLSSAWGCFSPQTGCDISLWSLDESVVAETQIYDAKLLESQSSVSVVKYRCADFGQLPLVVALGPATSCLCSWASLLFTCSDTAFVSCPSRTIAFFYRNTVPCNSSLFLGRHSVTDVLVSSLVSGQFFQDQYNAHRSHYRQFCVNKSHFLASLQLSLCYNICCFHRTAIRSYMERLKREREACD